MFNLPLWLTRRLSGNSHGKSHAGNVIAILGVTFAIAVMEITMAVSVGFKNEITQKLEGFIAPVSVTAPLTDNGIELSGLVRYDSFMLNPVVETVPRAKPVPSLTLQGVLKTEDDFSAIALKAYPMREFSTFERSNLVEGQWLDSLSDRQIVISKVVSDNLGLNVGDKLTFCYFVDNGIKARPLTVNGIYDSGFNEFDKFIAYVNPKFIQKIYHADNDEISMLELRNIDIEQVPGVVERLRSAYLEQAIRNENPEILYNISTVTEQGATYLNWLELLDTNVVVIFILMALVAVCTLISSLFIQVLDKVNIIGLLRALGARDGTLTKIFVYLALKLVGLGLIIGNIIGIGLIFAQQKWQFLTLNPQMYYLRYVPVHFDLTSVILLNIGVVIIAWLVLILPARLATRLSPAQTLRFD